MPPAELSVVDRPDAPSLVGARMVVGFPTHGLVASVAASYLVRALDLAPVAHVASDDFPPTVVMDGGLVHAPVRLYAGPGAGEAEPGLVVAVSDIHPPAPLLHPLGRRLLDWAEAKGVELVVAIEGQPLDAEVTGDARVVALANRAAAPLLERFGFEPASGVLTGFAGGLLLAALGRGLPTLCLVAQAHKDYPDARAAAKVIEALHPLLPRLALDTGPLRERARQIETEVRRNLEAQQKSMSPGRRGDEEGPGEMYR